MNLLRAEAGDRIDVVTSAILNAPPGVDTSPLIRVALLTSRREQLVFATGCVTVPSQLMNRTFSDDGVDWADRERIEHQMVQQYGPNQNLHKLLFLLREIALDIEGIKDLDILDLGCGSGSDWQFKPYLCRALHILGAKVTGVDLDWPCYEDADQISPSKGRCEDWDFRRMDIEHALESNEFPNNSRDVINCTSVFDHLRQYEVDGESCLASGLILGTPRHAEFEERFFENALRILRLGGLLVVNKSVYRKALGKDWHYYFETVKEGKPNLPYRYLDIAALEFGEKDEISPPVAS